MSTDSGVSDLIRQFQTRRLDTDPGDAFLFQPSAHTEPVRAAGTLPPPSRSFDRAPGRLFDRAPAHSLDRSASLPLDRALDSLDHPPGDSLDHAPRGRASRSIAPPLSLGRIPRATPPTHPTAPRDVVWPWIAATILAGILGVIGAEYLWRSLADEAAPARDPEIAASVTPPVAAPATDSTAVAPSATTLPSPASDPTPAAPQATDTPSSATGATAVDAIVPPPTAELAPTSTPHKTAHRRGRARAKTPRVTAKHAKAPAPAPAQAVTPVAAQPSPPSRPARPATQSSDGEDPL